MRSPDGPLFTFITWTRLQTVVVKGGVAPPFFNELPSAVVSEMGARLLQEITDPVERSYADGFCEGLIYARDEQERTPCRQFALQVAFHYLGGERTILEFRRQIPWMDIRAFTGLIGFLDALEWSITCSPERFATRFDACLEADRELAGSN